MRQEEMQVPSMGLVSGEDMPDRERDRYLSF